MPAGHASFHPGPGVEIPADLRCSWAIASPSAHDPNMLPRYVQLSLTVLLFRPIPHVLVHQCSGTARLGPMCRAIRVIPTFGTSQGATAAEWGTNPTEPNILASQAVRMIWAIPTSSAVWR